jgi:hypothetical protein
MPAQSRRSTSRPTRSQRRAGVQTSRTYSAPPVAARPVAPAPRRSYAAEPAPIDYTREFGWIRKDLWRILLWSVLILGVMVALSFVF